MVFEAQLLFNDLQYSSLRAWFLFYYGTMGVLGNIEIQESNSLIIKLSIQFREMEFFLT